MTQPNKTHTNKDGSFAWTVKNKITAAMEEERTLLRGDTCWLFTFRAQGDKRLYLDNNLAMSGNRMVKNMQTKILSFINADEDSTMSLASTPVKFYVPRMSWAPMTNYSTTCESDLDAHDTPAQMPTPPGDA